ncbi:MAG: hypothetical protein IAE79_07640 [Anaerolinea sp.]|nr:hypothetical protein [Anaerolinea sp.]
MATRYNMLRSGFVARERLLEEWLQLRQTGNTGGLLIGRLEKFDITEEQVATVRAINVLTNGRFADSLTARSLTSSYR